MLMLGPFAGFPALSAYCTVSLLGAFEGMNREAPAHAGSNLQRNARLFGSAAGALGVATEFFS